MEEFFRCLREMISCLFFEMKLMFFDFIWLANFCGLVEPVWAKGTSLFNLWQEECPVLHTCKTL